MKIISLKESLKKFPVFSVNDIRKIDPCFHSKQLVYWQSKGYLKKIINRWYCFTDTVVSEEFLLLTANNIYSPSYVSFETAFSYYQLIPEAVFSITSATTLKTNEFNTGIGTFSYHHLKPSLFFGYHLIDTVYGKIKMAEREKAVLDFFYINEKCNTMDAYAGIRINRDALLPRFNIKRMNAYLKLYSSNTLKSRVDGFMQFIQGA